jgi:DNA replication initiation complex subunit (GINS family)
MPDHYTQLLEWRRTEAAVRGLAKLPHDFYRSTAAYLAEMRTGYEAELRENPSSRKGEILRQTYQRATQVARDIVEARQQKVMSAAFQASIGGVRELPNSLLEERAIFDAMLGTLTEHRRAAAPYLEHHGPPTAATPPKRSEPPSVAAVATAPPPAAPVARPSRAPGPLTWVRILQGGRRIELGSETIDLRTDDVLSLPEESAKLLIDAKVAEPVTTSPAVPAT